MEELDEELESFQTRKAADLGGITLEVWKTRKCEDILQLCNAL